MRYQKVAHLGCVGRNADLPTQVDNCSDVRNHFCLRDKYRYFACLLRARFEEHRNEKDMMKATQLLREAEEEFWQNQHPQPYIFPESPGGTSYERYECYKVSEATQQLLLKDQLYPRPRPQLCIPRATEQRLYLPWQRNIFLSSLHKFSSKILQCTFGKAVFKCLVCSSSGVLELASLGWC